MRDEHPPGSRLDLIFAELPASWSRRPPTRRQILEFVRSAIAGRSLPRERERWLAERLARSFDSRGLTRREFLARSAAGGLAFVVVGRGALARADGTLSAPEGSLVAVLDAPTFAADFLRPQDMLALRFEFFNLDLVGGNLVRRVAGDEAFVVVHLAHGQKLSGVDTVMDHVPQNILEEAFPEPGPAPDPPGALAALLAGPTRLAFRVPTTVGAIPFTPDGLLDWAPLEQSVVPVALPPGATPLIPPPIRRPLGTETNIEAPWHLILSPNAGAGWAHASGPVTREGRTELWHTRLGVNHAGVVDETDADQRTVRAVWTEPDFHAGDDLGSPDPPPAEGFSRTSLTQDNRWQLVKRTSDFSLPSPNGTPVDVNRLMLTALGAWIDVRGSWPECGALSLLEWRHLATMGRDHYVKVVNCGYLFPFTHQAVLIEITERKFQPVPGGDLAGSPAAYLLKRQFIVVRQPVVTYPGAAPQPDEGRGMPFRRVRITTIVTPNLNPTVDPGKDPLTEVPDTAGDDDQVFWPRVGGVPGNDFLFGLIGEDTDGQRTEFAAPLIFVRSDVASDVGKMTALRDYYNDTLAVTDLRRRRPFHGHRVAMAKSSNSQGLPGGKLGDTSVEVNAMAFGATLATGAVDPDRPIFFPIWSEAAVRLEGVEQVRGAPLPSGVDIIPLTAFLTGGFGGGNPGQIFTKLKNPVDLLFSGAGSDAHGNSSGGVITPNMSIGGLSRSLGPVGGAVPDAAPPVDFDPAQFFSDAKILGGILLSDIIGTVLGFGDLAKVPKTTTRTIYPDNDPTRPPQAIETLMNFRPDLKADPAGIFDPDGASMTIDAAFRTPLDPPGEPTFDVVGDLRSFRVVMLGTAATFLILRFNRLTFTSSKNKKPHVDVDINAVEFAGALSFVNSLKDFLKSSGSGPSIDISLDPPGVKAGWTVAIPTVGVGVITIQNIALGAALNIPFTGDPARVRFNLSEREDPFLITVYGLGGGGFFAIAIGMDGVEVLEMSLEFGASVALDFGVASGEIHLLGGIYYKMKVVGDPNPDELELTAYIRMGGSVDVLGLITASIELYLGLKYELPPVDELWGQAKLTIEVEVLFFSASVTISVERRLPGSFSSSALAPITEAIAADPNRRLLGRGVTRNFADLVAQPDWNDYAAAFATIN